MIPASIPLTNAPKGIVHALSVAISGALLLLVVMLFAVLVVVPKLTGATPLTVLTSSMEPHLPPGTLIVVDPVNTDDLVIGDVATYQMHSGEPAVITHRIIAISSSTDGTRSFQFQGDNNSLPDPDLVLAAQIQGRLWYSVPLIGYANNFVNGASRAVIIPAVAVALLGYSTVRLVAGLRAARPRPRGAHRRVAV
ncbi:signal peptidase I [Cryobacterium sp. TMT1-3]|uniref:Signal peptidase I n=1 Tax=Cryobacterium luteum TaxID=1424661 RepID=A0A1H8AFX8_9MICO|nr:MULTISPECIES: signal peptidase I [Cryobacterium]TFB88509.1 signal peptidase I [Cryobacterium luteum]TFC24535.1 signal peptidase I [Cryobacterium sp. TMT1-3]SEM69640.1 signal peptidase, endoplasmic reticulum-type [Cryobacterium luteum]